MGTLSKEIILEEYRLYILPKAFGKQGAVDKCTFSGALKAMDIFSKQESFKFSIWKDELYELVDKGLYKLQVTPKGKPVQHISIEEVWKLFKNKK